MLLFRRRMPGVVWRTVSEAQTAPARETDPAPAVCDAACMDPSSGVPVLAANLVSTQRVGWVIKAVRGVEDRQGYEGHAQVPDLHEQPMQLGLIRDETAKAGRAVTFAGQSKAPEPSRPVVVEVAFYPKLVAGGPLSAGRPGDHAATLVVALPLRRLLIRRRRRYSATARLMAQPAPSMRS